MKKILHFVLLITLILSVNLEESSSVAPTDQTNQEEHMNQESTKIKPDDEIQHEQQNTQNQMFDDLLILRLRNSEHIFEDINDGFKVLLFVENNKNDLKNKTSDEAIARKNLIKLLRANRNQEDIKNTAMYFTNCKFVKHLCDELKISKKENEIVLITKFRSSIIKFTDPELESKVMSELTQPLQEIEDMATLNQLMSEKNIQNAIIFNTDQENLDQQLSRADKLRSKCSHECFNDHLFVTIKNKDTFLESDENLGKTFLFKNGENILTPFKMKGDGKMGLYKSLKFINNEGLDDVLHHNGDNYFKIYQNNLKALIILAVNTDDLDKKDKLLASFNEAARRHRELRPDYRDRYAFVYSDIINGEEYYNNMLLEVTGNLTIDSEVFIFTKDHHKLSYKNLSLTDNYHDLREFMVDIPYEITRAKEILAKEENNQEISSVEKVDLEFYKLYQKEWLLINGIMKMTESDDNDGSSDITARNILGFITANDIGKVHELYYKSEEEDREHNDENLEKGVLFVTGKNFDRLIYGINKEESIPSERAHSFILLICRNVDKKIEKDCIRVSNLLAFIREKFPHKDSQIRLGVMDTVFNDHPRIEKMNIKKYPIIAFFGKKNAKGNAKLYKQALIIEKLLNWLNKRFSHHEDGVVKLTEDDYHTLLLLTAKNKK